MFSQICFLQVITLFFTGAVYAGHPLTTDDTGTEGKGSEKVKTTVKYDHNDVDGNGKSSSKFAIAVIYILVLALALLAFTPRCFAVPPLITGDVPTADQKTFEWYVGWRYQESETGNPSRLLPSTELVYGLTDRMELTFETAGTSKDHQYGLSDSVVGTKYVFLKETGRWPGVAGSFELKLPTGGESRGLGSGEFDYDLRLRAQKTWGWFTAMGNIGYTFVTDPEFGGGTTSMENVWLLTFAQEYQIAKKTKLLSEIYFVSREAPGDANRIAANIGFKHKLRDNLNVHATIGKSVREGNRGGPDLRVYVGVKWEFGTPWKRKE